MTRLLLLVIVLMVSACESTGDPSTGDLYGTWVNLDEGVVRAFTFEHDAGASCGDLCGLSPVYRLYLYDEGDAPEEVQRGTYDVSEGHLVTSVVASTDSTIVGESFANEIRSYSGSRLVLESGSTPSGSRAFSKADGLP